MNLAMVKPFPDLPADLARYFFELAAWDDPCTAERLTRVSKLVRQWIDPILYHTVVLHAVSQLLQFHQSITLRDDSAFFARNVKLLRIGNLTNDNFDCVIHDFPHERQMELVHDVLNVCSGVRRLAFWLLIGNCCGALQAFTGISGSRHLTHLSLLDVMSNSYFARNDLKFVPPSLTHLHLDIASDKHWQCIPWQMFSEFPRLSHICLSGRIATIFLLFPDILSSLVDSIAVLPHTITAFVVLVDRLIPPDKQLVSQLETLPAVADRLVIISRNSSSAARIPRLHCFSGDHTVESDWGHGTGLDTWELADICLAKQRQRRQDELAR